MDEDLICSLNRQIKEDILENYLTERRLVCLQIEDVEKQADGARERAVRAGRRLNRMVHQMIHPEMVERLYALLNVPQPSFWSNCSEKKQSRRIQFIRVRALTDRAKFRKLVVESYNRLTQWMERYRKTYEQLSGQCRAVNSNIKHFNQNFDLLTILSFLKSLDTSTIERKQFLGGNFTAEELASVDQKLYIGPIRFESLQVPAPLILPRLESVESSLTELANEVYRKYQKHVQRFLE
jgi:hypothetical protein